LQQQFEKNFSNLKSVIFLHSYYQTHPNFLNLNSCHFCFLIAFLPHLLCQQHRHWSCFDLSHHKRDLTSHPYVLGCGKTFKFFSLVGIHMNFHFEDFVVKYIANSLLLQLALLIAYYMSNPKGASAKAWPKVVTLAYSHVDTHLFLKSFYIQRTKLMTIKEINTTILDIKYSNASTFEQTPWLVSPPNSFFLSIPTSYQKQKKKLKLGILMMGSKNCKGFTV